MEKDQINRHFLAYAAASRDLNPIIDGKPYPLPRKQGEFFFHYKLMQEDPAYREKNFYWMHNFKVLLTNGSPCMPPERLDELTQYGSVNFFTTPSADSMNSTPSKACGVNCPSRISAILHAPSCSTTTAVVCRPSSRTVPGAMTWWNATENG